MKNLAKLVEALEPRQLLAAYPVSVGSTAYDSAFKITKLANDGVLVAGLFKGTIDLDPSSRQVLFTALGDTDIYVARYSEAGGLVWARQFGGTEGDFEDNKDVDTPTDPARAGPFDLGVGLQPADLGEYVTAVAFDASENFYIAGSFRGSVDFDPSSRKRVLSSTGGKEFIDIFLLKLNIDGNLVFVKQIGGPFTDVAQGMAVSGSSVFLTGYYTRLADFDPGPAQVNLSTLDRSRENIFVARYDTNGALVWTKDIANNDIDRVRRNVGNAIVVDAQLNSYIAGSFSARTDFDPSSGQTFVTAFRETDSFLLKLTSSGALAYVKTFGGDDFDGAQEIALTPQGKLYLASYFGDTVDADPNPAVVRNVYATPEEIGDDPERTDLLISSFNPLNGALIWAKSVGSDGWETIGGLGTNPSDGSVFLSGGFYDSADFDPGRGRAVLTSTVGADDFDDRNDGDRDNSYDAFLWKLDVNGRYVFAQRFGAQSDDYATALSVDPANGNVAIAGQFRGSIRLPPSSAKLRPIGLEDSFVSLYSALGDLLS